MRFGHLRIYVGMICYQSSLILLSVSVFVPFLRLFPPPFHNRGLSDGFAGCRVASLRRSRAPRQAEL